MSFYNMIMGANPAVFFILPMLGERHPDEYPRFRDCFIEQEEGKEPEIHVYTRVGGGNRNDGFGEEELYKHPNFLRTWDDDFDNTYATYAFSVPEEWREDFKKVSSGNIKEVSAAYKERLYKVFPKLNEKFDEIFNLQRENKE
jgi:hypothetical protein